MKKSLSSWRGYLPGWRTWRRIVQIAVVVLFVWLFRRTEMSVVSGETGAVPYWSNLFFRLDPLIAATAMLAAKTVIVTMLLAGVTLVVTALLGRVFCGWFCPLGTILDGVGGMMRIDRKRDGGLRARPWWRSTRYILLILTLIAAPLGLPLVGYVDPFSLLYRGMSLAVDPWMSQGAFTGSSWLYLNAPESVTKLSEPTYDWLKGGALPGRVVAFGATGAGISLGILLVIVLLERIERRFWCRNLCPLGAGLGLVARLSPLRRKPARSCAGCRQCEQTCRMDAFDSEHKLMPEACTLCMDCVKNCPHQIADFGFKIPGFVASAKPSPSQQPARVDVSRRVFLTGVAAGVALPAMHHAVGYLPASARPTKLQAVLRPVGAGHDVDRFNDLCVRCGLCMKVCPTNALHPLMLKGGIEGLFTPELVPVRGYCEYNCNLCGEVCPTGAIAPFDLETKHVTPIGLAVFDKNRCMPWATGEMCMCCEEMCPVHEKAIRWRWGTWEGPDGEKIEVQQPYVMERLCIGCGICENKCPLDEPAIKVKPGPHAMRSSQGAGQGQGNGHGGGGGGGSGRGAGGGGHGGEGGGYGR